MRRSIRDRQRLTLIAVRGVRLVAVVEDLVIIVTTYDCQSLKVFLQR